MPFSTDTRRAESVCEATLAIAADLFPGAPAGGIREAFQAVESLFTGGHPDYQANDLKYHDFQHTLQVAMAYADLIAARQRHASAPRPVTFRQFELGLIAALFHDSGYLKLRSDREGTGAKYTYCHVLRGCALAASSLPALGLAPDEIDVVLDAIRGTGPTTLGMRRHDAGHDGQILSCAVATADYLGQMAAADYPDKLEGLFGEFAESDDFTGIPPDRRAFPDAAALIADTSAFWTQVVLPRLDRDFLGLHRFLDTPDGANSYLDAIGRNLRIISRRASPASR